MSIPPRSTGTRRVAPLRVSRTMAAAGTPLYRQLYEQLRDRIESGSLAPGARLPSSRDLTRSLRVARNTVEGALALLVAEGWIERRVGAGTIVAARPGDRPDRRLEESSPAERASQNVMP